MPACLRRCIGAAVRTQRILPQGMLWIVALLACSGCTHFGQSSLSIDQPRSPARIVAPLQTEAAPQLKRSNEWLRQIAIESDGPPLVTLLPPTDEFGVAVGHSVPRQEPAFDWSLAAEQREGGRHSKPSEEPLLLAGSRLEEQTKADDDTRTSVWDEVVSDHCYFYSSRSLSILGLTFGSGAVMAHTAIDRNLHDFVQDNVRNANSDEWTETLGLNKEIGNGFYTLPLFGVAAIAGRYYDDVNPVRNVGEWGERSLRTFVVGAPPLVAGQLLTGGSRPYELSKTAHNSHWHPFQDNNGVSGHAFMGAIPFLSVAKMAENPWVKGSFYVASTLPGLSRINDGAHYSSQVLLGWTLAYLASEAVDETFDDVHEKRSAWHLLPLPVSSGHGLAIERRW